MFLSTSTRYGGVSNRIGLGWRMYVQVRSHHTDTIKVKIVSTTNKVMIHPIGRYILDWSITDQNGQKTDYTQKLSTMTKTQIYHDHDTESLFIPHFIEPLSPEADAAMTKYAWNKPWYAYPIRKAIINVDLWLIPPSVLAMLMKKDSNLVEHKRLHILLKRF